MASESIRSGKAQARPLVAPEHKHLHAGPRVKHGAGPSTNVAPRRAVVLIAETRVSLLPVS